MNTINQHISNIRGALEELGRNPGVYTDQMIYSFFNGAATKILKDRNSQKNFNSQWDYTFFPMPLINSKSHLAGCISVGCDIKRSQYKLPRALLIRNKSMIDVYTFDYTPIILGTEIDWLNNQYDDVKKNKINASIINDYLVIWNGDKLKAVLLKGIWDDITAWAEIPQYDEDCNLVGSTCFDPLSQNYPLSESLKLDAYDLTIKMLLVAKHGVSDMTNDSNNEIRT